MNGDAEINLIGVFFLPFFHYSEIDQSFGNVVHDESGPNFLLHANRLKRMKIAKTNRVFQLAKRGFDTPSAEVKFLNSNFAAG